MRRIGGSIVVMLLAIASCATPPQAVEPRSAPGGASVGPSESVAPPSVDPSSAPARVPSSHVYEPPDPLPAGPLGSILRSEPLEAPDGVRAWAILSLSSGTNGAAIAVSGIVLSPEGEAPAEGRPVLAWAHGSRGVSDACAPSHDGAADLITVAQPFLDRGYVVVATDYEGLGTPGTHPFLVGPSEGRGVLDAARAARLVRDSGAGSRVALLGHSQGGHAVLWAAELAPTYAPELEIAGAVAAAPAGDLVAIATAIRRQGAPDIDRLIGLQIVSVWHELYGLPMDSVLSPPDQMRAARLQDMCPDFALTPPEQPLMIDLTTIREWRERLEVNTPGATKAAAPLLILHGTADDTIPIETTRSEVQRLCRAGDTVEFRTIEGADHGDPLYGEGRLTELVQWSTDRLDGDPATSTCSQ